MVQALSGGRRVRWLLVTALLAAVAGLAIADIGAGDRPATVSAQSSTTINANDYASIQAAVDSLKDTGGAVYIPAGTHLLAAKLRIYSNVTIFGDGMDVTILKLASGVYDNVVSNSSLSSGNSNIGIFDLTIQGQSGGTSRYLCLRLVHVSGVKVINVAADGCTLDGIYLGYYTSSSGTYGADNVRISGCRATYNGRNGISITHGQGNIIDHCQISNNNRNEAVAGLDIEPDQGLNVSNTKVVSNTANRQNVGVQLYAYDPRQVTLTNNAVCTNTVQNNSSAGIWDTGYQDIFVSNSTSGNGTNFLVDSSAKQGSAYASACDLPPTPTAPPKPSSGGTATPTATAGLTGTATPTATATVPPNTATPTATNTSTPTKTPVPTRTPKPTKTAVLTSTATSTRTATPVGAVSGTATRTPTATATVSAVSGPTLTADTTLAEPGWSVKAKWSGIVSPSAYDWLGMYSSAGLDTEPLVWMFVKCSQTATSAAASGYCNFTMPSTLGDYEFRLFANNTYNRLATSNTVTVVPTGTLGD